MPQQLIKIYISVTEGLRLDYEHPVWLFYYFESSKVRSVFSDKEEKSTLNGSMLKKLSATAPKEEEDGKEAVA